MLLGFGYEFQIQVLRFVSFKVSTHRDISPIFLTHTKNLRYGNYYIICLMNVIIYIDSYIYKFNLNKKTKILWVSFDGDMT